ncbi:tryptophan synthase subunit alpha [Constantimarinum furrinae]|uniref:Tryptophan synthase alpha chain n=1 Tax=Constantimarinum furrinae TaxID=2562285 RepID=A0A7G8PV23_9FLAO|nr:tryptophan synthase subunit alpha [Constantimarinum furrinae]QNJ98189.1 tryptophan synthase alpha chain [Constantimarinum furrinae]
MNRIKNKLSENNKLLSIYYTAGFPQLQDTVPILESLQQNGVDMVEIGLPFSDPIADGPTIQQSSAAALQNGMTTTVLFDQLKDIRKTVSIPLILMGYFNPVLQYGVEEFCKKCNEIGIDGLILPDLPLEEYTLHYRPIFEKYMLSNIFLVTPQTPLARIKEIDSISNTFIYLVSSAGTTGTTRDISEAQQVYFKRISAMKLSKPVIVGFGIKDKASFNEATKHTHGAIIGSAFIKMLATKGLRGVTEFITALRKV